MPTNLLPGQYQIGDLVFGRGTVYPVTSVEIQSYNVQAGDYAAPFSDDVTMGIDALVPGPIMFKIGVMDFQGISTMEMLGGKKFHDTSMARAVNKIAAEWRGDDVRKNPGALKALRFCERDGTVKVWYGRPRKFQASKRSRKSEFFTIDAEFQRSDTLVYNDREDAQSVLLGARPTVVNRLGGEAAAWLRIIGYGPITHPVITIGEQQVELDISVAAGEAFEVSSYPWQRRAITNTGRNIASKMIGDTQYLDRLRLPPSGLPTYVRWTSDEANTWVPAMGNQSWAESIEGVSNLNLPNTFQNLAGKVVVRFDLFNPDWAEKFLGSGIFGTTSTCVYRSKKFNTANQYCEAKIVEPWGGRSGIAIMSNSGMTNYVLLEIVSGPFNDKIRIRNGTGPTTFGPVRAEYSKSFPWQEWDVVGIEAKTAFGVTTYIAYLNDKEVCRWVDTGGVVDNSASNRSQGFVFDLDGGLLTVGTGFKDIVAYDKSVVPAPTGKLFVTWRDAYTVAS